MREKFSCRECEKIAQPPAPFHVTPRGFAGLNLLAAILFEKFGQSAAKPAERKLSPRRHRPQPFDTRRPGRCLRRDLEALHRLIEAHVLSAERLHGHDTTVPILAKGKTDTGRIWTYVRG